MSVNYEKIDESYTNVKDRIWGLQQAHLLVRYKAVLLESSFLDSSACSFIYFCTASSVILPIVST